MAAAAHDAKTLSDSVIQAGNRLDAAAMTARFEAGLGAAIGGATGMLLNSSQLVGLTPPADDARRP